MADDTSLDDRVWMVRINFMCLDISNRFVVSMMRPGRFINGVDWGKKSKLQN